MILDNLLENSGECSYFSIPGNVPEDSGNVRKDSGECSGKFRGMLSKILGNIQEGSGECSGKLPGMLSILN